MGSPFALILLHIHPTKRLRQTMHQGFKKRRVVRTWDRRDPAVQVRLSMGPPAPDVLLACCGGGRPWAPPPSRCRASRRRGDERSGTMKSLKRWPSISSRRKALKAHQWSRPSIFFFFEENGQGPVGMLGCRGWATGQATGLHMWSSHGLDYSRGNQEKNN